MKTVELATPENVVACRKRREDSEEAQKLNGMAKLSLEWGFE